MLLFHGSKSGIHGDIQPISRDKCDFGRGFYMGTDEQQPLTLICNFAAPILYTVDFDTEDLRVLDLSLDLDWALLIAFNRGKLEIAHSSALYTRISTLSDGFDVVSGAIANDRMFIVLDRFFNGEITDAALVACLSALQLGRQYAAITQRACDKATIVGEHALNPEELDALRDASELNRAKGIALAEAICREHRREGRFFDEIVSADR